MNTKIVCKTRIDKSSVIELLNKFIKNGHHLDRSFIQIVTDEHGHFHVFHDSSLDEPKYQIL